MNISHLRYLIEVIDNQSISKASEKLYISQPALSSAITHLEKELGHYIIKRNGRGVEPTEFGKQLYGIAKNIANELVKINNLVDETDRSTHIKVATIPAATTLLLPQVNKLFKEKYPSVNNISVIEKPIPTGEISVSTDEFTFIITNYKQGDSELASGLSKKKVLMSHILFRNSIVAYLNAEHPLMKQSGAITIKDLAHYPVALIGSIIPTFLRKYGIYENMNIIRTIDRDSIKKLIYKEKEVIGILPKIFALDDIYTETGVIKIKTISDCNIIMNNCVYYDKAKGLTQLEKNYLQLLIEQGKLIEKRLNSS
ncbi:MAG: LysR family transcriptional regulator [Dehalobacterium sp.]